MLPVGPDEWDRLASVEHLLRGRAARPGWEALSISLHVQDARGEYDADTVQGARESPVGRRGKIANLTMAVTARGTVGDSSATRSVQVYLDAARGGRAEVRGPDDVEVAGLASRIEDLLAPSKDRRDLPRVLPWLSAPVLAILTGVISSVLTALILFGLGIS
jgi:hypothetical protein